MHPKLIDTHCHLNYDYLPKTVDDLVREANEVGVEALVTIGTDLDSIAQVQSISERIDCVYHTIGIHPHEAITLQDSDLERLRMAAQHPKCRAIGEIGLDYHYDHSPRPIQKKRLEQQLAIALELHLPVVIHSREGEADLLECLTSYSQQVKGPGGPGIIHCFSGTLEFGKACLDLGFSISFSGILTFKKADEIRAAAEHFPLERIVVETDSPYLAPVPFRGKKCEPSMVRMTAQKLSEVKNVSLEKLAQITTANAKRIFQMT